MKVLLVVPSLRKTGVTEVIKALIKENNESKSINYVLLALRSGFPKEEKAFGKLVNLYVLKSPHIFSLNKVNQVKEIIKTVEPDAIHFHGFNAEIYIPWIKNRKIISTVHNMGKVDFVFSYGRIIGNIMSIVQKWIYKRVDILVAVSDTVKKEYQQLGFNNIKTIYNGVRIPCEFQNRYGKRHSTPVGVYVGNLEKRKNIGVLLNTFTKFKNYKLIVVGDDVNNPTNINHFINKYKNVKFVGRVENVYPYLINADYYISASLAEGLPMAAIEAMGMNLDLLLSDISPHRELKKDSDQNIYFFTPSEKKMFETLDKYFKGYKLEKSLKNKKVFERNFSSEIMFKNYLKIYLTK